MNILELKGSLLQLIANVKDEALLLDVYQIITDRFQQHDKDWWDELNKSQQKELDTAINESYEDKNLVPDKAARQMIFQRRL